MPFLHHVFWIVFHELRFEWCSFIYRTLQWSLPLALPTGELTPVAYFVNQLLNTFYFMECSTFWENLQYIWLVTWLLIIKTDSSNRWSLLDKLCSLLSLLQNQIGIHQCLHGYTHCRLGHICRTLSGSIPPHPFPQVNSSLCFYVALQQRHCRHHPVDGLQWNVG